MLSETSHGLAWLDNFEPGDRDVAKRALDGLTVLNWSAIRPKLLDLVTEVLESVKGPSWILPLMATEDILAVTGLPDEASLVPFESYPVGAGIASLPGSEGMVGNMLRDLLGKEDVLAPNVPLHQLRESRVRSAVVVTDYSGSGSQVRRFVRILLSNPSLKSWHSFGWLRVHVVAFAVSAEARATIGRLHEVDQLHAVMTAPAIADQPWSSKTKNAVIELCRRYPPGVGGLGYRQHGGLYALEESVPNTLPEMFTHQGAGWASLFGDRTTPTRLSVELSLSDDSVADLSGAAREFGQERLSTALGRQMRTESRQLLTVLAAFLVSKGSRDRAELALGANRRDSDRIVDYLISIGWLDSELRVTRAGRGELVAGKARTRKVPRAQISTPDPSPYYPRSLR
jgi:hypothetical protein